MPKDVTFNIKLNIDGKEHAVAASTNVKEPAKQLEIVPDIVNKAGKGSLDRHKKAPQTLSTRLSLSLWTSLGLNQGPPDYESF